MAEKKFSNKEAIKFGWETFKKHLGFFLILGIIVLVISVLPGLAEEFAKKSNTVLLKTILYTLYLLFHVFNMVVSLGVIKIALKFIDNQKVEFSDLFSQYNLFFKYLLGSIIYLLIIIAGTILFIIPGIIWSIKFQYFPYFIVEGSGPIEAIKKSGQITMGSKWHLFIFGIVLVLITLAGLLVFFVGILIAMPIVMLATAFVYRKLKSQMSFFENPVK